MKTFRRAIRENDFVVSAEPLLSPNLTAADVRHHIETLRPDVDAIQIGDNRAAQAHMSPLAVAAIALSLDLDPVVHVTCRDHNRLALQSLMLGASALGVSSLVLARGQKVPAELRGKVKGVFDTTVIQLLQMAQIVGNNTNAENFFVGSYVPVIKPKAQWTAAQVVERISAGSSFLQTRPCLNVKILRTYMQRVVAQKLLHRVAFVVEVPLLSSTAMVEQIKTGSPGSLLPQRLINRVVNAANPAAEGITLLGEVLTEILDIPGIAGVNIVYDGEPEKVLEALRAASLGKSG